MSDLSPAFTLACTHAMIYEVGGWFNANDKETILGLIATPPQCKKVGYSIDPNDRGGETKFGVAKNANTDLDITNLTWDQALTCYYNRYWLPGGCNLLSSSRVAILHFDGCVNHGVGTAGQFLQEVVGAQPVDGQVGPVTARAVASMNEFDVCRLLCDRREKFYRDIVANDPSQAKFINGWMNRINDIRDFVRGPISV